MRLHVSDRVQLRGVSDDRDLEDMAEDIVVVSSGSDRPCTKKREKVLLCSPCQGRGEVWVKGVCFRGGENGWVNTGIYGMWREDGVIEVLDV